MQSCDNDVLEYLELMKTRKTVLVIVFIATLFKLAAVETVPLRFEWTYTNIAPDSFKLYDAATLAGPYVPIAVFPGASNGITVTNLAIKADPAFNHFWFLTASNVLGESLPSNTVTGASPGQVIGLKLFQNKSN